MSTENEHNWWDNLPDTIGDFDARDISGGVIIASVGDGAQNVAIGKDITQSIYTVLGEPTEDDKQIIQEQFAEVRGTLKQAEPEIGKSAEKMAQGLLTQMENELVNTSADKAPNASAITQIGDLLLDSVPQIAQALASLFATPAVGRVVGKAGEAAVSWVKTRFGST